MKTIDDVLKAYDICINEKSCDDCPYTEHNTEGKWACSLCGDCTRDTVYYLQQYKKTKELLFDGLKRLEESEKYFIERRAYYEQAIENFNSNNPLAWDELKQMIGKPVWFEAESDEIEFRDWMLIAENINNGISLFGLKMSYFLRMEDYGKTKRAYRKEHYDN